MDLKKDVVFLEGEKSDILCFSYSQNL
jgi:hypothetical protein